MGWGVSSGRAASLPGRAGWERDGRGGGCGERSSGAPPAPSPTPGDPAAPCALPAPQPRPVPPDVSGGGEVERDGP